MNARRAEDFERQVLAEPNIVNNAWMQERAMHVDKGQVDVRVVFQQQIVVDDQNRDCVVGLRLRPVLYVVS